MLKMIFFKGNHKANICLPNLWNHLHTCREQGRDQQCAASEAQPQKEAQFPSCSFDHLCGSFVHHVYLTTKVPVLERV